MHTVEPEAAQGALIGIVGGTFDPIHLAHLMMAEQAREQLGLSRVLFIPAGKPPHKLAAPVSRPEHRLAMAQAACASNPFFEVSRREIDRPGPSYTIATIREVKAETGLGVCFIMGADSVLEMAAWRQPDDILDEATVVTIPRPGFDLSRVPQALGPRRAAQVKVLEAPMMDLSSTEIRRRVRAGLSIRYLVLDGVAEYIREHRLYLAD